MTHRARFSPAADHDLDEQVNFIATDNPAAALRFYLQVQDTCDLLIRWPEMGAAYESSQSKLRGIRVLPVRGFERFLIFYRALPDGILVVRILHSARDIRRIL